MQPLQPEIRIAAALLLRANRETLLVRKKGTTAFMQPGGKIERGETPRATLARELKEELGLDISPAAMKPFGRFEAEAANEPGHIVVADVFRIDLVDTHVSSAAEIEEAVWISACETPTLPLAPLTRNCVLPLYCQVHAGVEL